jgi:hypothetical protein
LVVVYDGSLVAADRIKVYKNGKLISGSVTGTIPTSMDTATTTNLKLGDSDATGTNGLLAYYDELKIYSSAPSASKYL